MAEHMPEIQLRAVRTPVAHDSAAKHVRGAAAFADDILEPEGTLHVAVGGAPVAHGELKGLDLDAVRSAPGVVAVLTAADIPGVNDVGPIVHDDPVFADKDIQFWGQALFAVVATSRLAARKAVLAAKADVKPLQPVLTIEESLEAGITVLPDYGISRGDPDAALASAPHRSSGKLSLGGQEHFYLEGQVSLAVPLEDGDMLLHCSTQHPSEVQQAVAHVLGVPSHAVTVECRRMGGGFGGKETQGAQWAAIAALAARATAKPCKLRLDRDDDMMLTGKRHDFLIRYDAGFNDEGIVTGVKIDFASRCGYSADLSGGVNDRTVLHGDNAYWLENCAFHNVRCKTHTASNTAFRGFGGPQGIMGIEKVLDGIARALGIDPLDVRKRNLYGKHEHNVTPYGMTIIDNVAPELVDQLEASSDYRARRSEIAAFNEKSPYLKRGLALTPVKFGISFTVTHLNQAGALVHVYQDGSVALNHGGTEMGQGLFMKVAQVVADVFGIDLERVKITATNTAKVPNTSPTAASSGSDLNGMAAHIAASTIRERLTDFAAEHFGVPADQIAFRDNKVFYGNEAISFDELIGQAYLARVSLSSTGFYKTPFIDYDRDAGRGRPFYYFAYGAACSEVCIDTLTGEMRVKRVDILHDVGHSLNPAIDFGQIEGAFVQGMGWLTTEELCWNDQGRLTTHAPSTYKIPTASDVPEDFRVAIFKSDGNREETIHSSKAVGEPPLNHGISVWCAIADAISSIGGYRIDPPLDAPATPEAILRAVTAVKAQVAERGS